MADSKAKVNENLEEYVLQSMKPIFRSKVEKSNVYFSYELKYCNGHQPYSFSDAYIDFKFPPPGHRREVTTALTLGELICDAFSVIRHDDVCGIRIERPLGAAEEDLSVIQEGALQCLLSFMADYKHHEKCLGKAISEIVPLTETSICELLAVHLFSPLVPGQDVILADGMKGRRKDNKCPCGCKISVKSGSTGIGHQKVWHGFPDMLVKYSSVSVQPLAVSRDVEDEAEDTHEDSLPGPSERKRTKTEEVEDLYYFIEIKGKDTSIYSNQFMTQLVSQSITNGFAMKTRYDFRNQMVPSIGCNLHQLHIFLYNPDADILMRRKECLELFSREFPHRLILPSVVELWLILNLHAYGSAMSEINAARLNKCGFKDLMRKENVLQYYYQSKVGVDKGKLTGHCTPANHNPAIMTSDYMFKVLD